MSKKAVIIWIAIIVVFIAIISNYVGKDLNYKTIVFCGDSLMDGYENDYHSFEYYFKQYIPDAELINYSKSGSTISDNTGAGEVCIINQVKSISGCLPDVIVLDGGANDIISYGLGFNSKDLMKDIGEANEDPNEMTDTDTVLGDFEELIVETQKLYPEAKLCYLQMFLIDDDTINHITVDGSARPVMKERRDALFEGIQKICLKRNVKYVDVATKLEGTGLKYRQEDYIHIKRTGYMYLTPYVIEKLEDIL